MKDLVAQFDKSVIKIEFKTDKRGELVGILKEVVFWKGKALFLVHTEYLNKLFVVSKDEIRDIWSPSIEFDITICDLPKLIEYKRRES